MPEITEAAISAYLDKRGIRYAVGGRKYLIEAIRYRLDHPGFFKITALYDTIGKSNGATGSRVERAIRHAIESSKDINDAGELTHNHDAHGDATTNKEFLERAVSDLTLAAK